ncbi:hypothetical protein NBRC116602_07040 [Hyphomicrobiales bacterium 4NK60-0047b]
MTNLNSTTHLGTYIVHSACGELKVTSMPHKQCDKTTDQYCQTFSEALLDKDTNQHLLGFDKGTLAARDAHIVVAETSCGKFLGGLHCQTSGDHLWLRGAVVKPLFRGNRIGATMAATGLVHAHTSNVSLPTPVCSIRVYSDGSENVASRKTFERLGFQAHADINQVYLNLDQSDRHRKSTAERDAQGSYYTLSRKLYGTARVYDIARNFLADWTKREAE